MGAAGVGIERVVLRLDRPALTGVGPAGEALRDEAVDPGRTCRCEQRVGTLAPQPVGLRERPIEVLEVVGAGKGRRLVHDRVGPGGGDGFPYGAWVEYVEHDRLRTQGTQTISLLRRAAAADHFVAPLDSWGTSLEPIAPVAPATKTRMVSPFGFSTQETRRRTNP